MNKKTGCAIIALLIALILLTSCAGDRSALYDTTELYTNSAVRLKSFGQMFGVSPIVGKDGPSYNAYDNATEYCYVIYDIDKGLEHIGAYQEYLLGEGGFTLGNRQEHQDGTGISYKYLKSTWVLGVAYSTGVDTDRGDLEYIMILISVPCTDKQS